MLLLETKFSQPFSCSICICYVHSKYCTSGKKNPYSMFFNSTQSLRVFASLSLCRASCKLHSRPFNTMAVFPASPIHRFSLQNGLKEPYRRDASHLGYPALQRYMAGLYRQCPPRHPGGNQTCCMPAKRAAAENSSSAINPFCEEGRSQVLQQNSASSSISDQSILSYADEVGQATESSSLNKLSIGPGQVHVWWLFPDDVRSPPTPQSCWACRETSLHFNPPCNGYIRILNESVFDDSP